MRDVLMASAGAQTNYLHKQVFHLLADYLEEKIDDKVFLRMKKECCINGVTLHGVLLSYIPELFGRIGVTSVRRDYELLHQITMLNLIVSLMTNQITRMRFDEIKVKLERWALENGKK